MTETLYKSSDVPDFDTYPSNQPERFLASEAHGGEVLIRRAQQIGAALGSAVSQLRKARRRLQELSDQTAQTAVTRMSEMAGTAKAKAQEFGHEATMRASGLADAVVEKAKQVGEKTKYGYFRARRRANQISRDYPVHTLVAIGIIGIVVGTGIRIWRANRAN
jgi:hypothetical protein